MEKKSDISLVKTVVHFYGIFGFFSYIKKYLLIILIPFYLVAIICFAKVFIEFMSVIDVSFIGLIIYALYFIHIIMFTLQSLRNAYTQEPLWSSVFSDVEAFDFLMKEHGSLHEEPVYKFYATIIVSNVVYIPFHFLTQSTKWKSWDYELVMAIIYSDLVFLQIIVTILVLKKILNIIEIRYDFFKTEIKKALSPTNETVWNVHKFNSSFLLLDTIVEKVNELFGKKILAIVTLTFLYVLACFQFSLLEDHRNEFKDLVITISAVGELLTLLVSIYLN